MKKLYRLLSAVLAVAVIVSLTVTAFARPNDKYIVTPNDINYEINVKNNKITLISNQKTPQQYNSKDAKLALRVDDNGLVLCFVTSGNNNKEVILGKGVKQLSITGSMNELALADSIDYHYSFEIGGKVNYFTITGTCKVNLTENATINNLSVHNSEAEVTYEDGATVVAKNTELASDIYLDIEIREYNYFTGHGCYDGNTKTITLPATMEGCTVSEAVRDAVIKVREKNGGDLVSGRWYWPNLNGSSTESGNYVYRFAPTDNKYKTAQVTINFISYEDNQKVF